MPPAAIVQPPLEPQVHRARVQFVPPSQPAPAVTRLIPINYGTRFEGVADNDLRFHRMDGTTDDQRAVRVDPRIIEGIKQLAETLNGLSHTFQNVLWALRQGDSLESQENNLRQIGYDLDYAIPDTTRVVQNMTDISNVPE